MYNDDSGRDVQIQIQNKDIEYVGGKHKLFVCYLNITLVKLKLQICC